MGTMFFGSDKQDANLIFDTGSSWLTVTSNMCENCNSQKFNVKTSTTASQVDKTTFRQVYGSATLSGYKYNDTVCLTDAVSGDSCLNNF